MPKSKDAQQRFRAGERAFCVGERALLLHAYLISTRVPIFEKHRVIFARYCLGSCDLEYITVFYRMYTIIIGVACARVLF